jgi:hypothetical protein
LSAPNRDVPGVPGAIAREAARLDDHLPGGVRYSHLGETVDDKILLRIRGVGRFLITGGETIDYYIEPGADPADAEAFLWGAARSALIHQRGDLPFHACAIARPDGTGAIAICGPSGAGKSTTTAALAGLGWRVLADDLTRISMEAEQAMAWPGPAYIKLLPDACQDLAIETAGLKAAGAGDGKFLVPVPGSREATRLTAIVELGGGEVSPRLERLDGAEAMAVLSRHVVGPRKMRALRTAEQHFSLVTGLSRAVSVYRLHGRQSASAAVLAGEVHGGLG